MGGVWGAAARRAAHEEEQEDGGGADQQHRFEVVQVGDDGGLLVDHTASSMAAPFAVRRVEHWLPAAVPRTTELNGVTRAARSAWATWMLRASSAEGGGDADGAADIAQQGEQRRRVGAQVGSSVAKAITCSGMNTKPSPAPWTTVLPITVQRSTSGVQPVMSYRRTGQDQMPIAMSQRGSMLASRPAISIAAIVPRPRGAMDQAGGGDGVAAENLQPGREQGGTGQQHHADREHDREAGGEVAVLEDRAAG